MCEQSLVELQERGSTCLWHLRGTIAGAVERLEESRLILRAAYSDLVHFQHKYLQVDGDLAEDYPLADLSLQFESTEARASELIDLLDAALQAWSDESQGVSDSSQDPMAGKASTYDA